MGLAADRVLRIGGFMFSKKSVAVTVDAVPFEGIYEINSEESREGEYQYGQRTDGTPLGYTSGQYNPGTLSFKTYVDTGEMMLQQLSLAAAINGSGSFGSATFPLMCEIFESPLKPTLTLIWSGVKIEKRKFTVPTDQSGLAYEFECKYLSFTSVGEGLGLTGIPSILSDYTSVL